MTQKYFVIGVDGGATKTVAALADLNGKILKIGKAGSSNARNIGVESAAQNIVVAIKKILPKNKIKISSVFIGLPGIQESPERAPKFQREIFNDKKISLIFREKFKIASDQIVAFQSGTDEKNGIVLIAGTGCAAYGWKKKKEHKSGGWGWLTDEGSAFWAGQKIFQAVLKDLDGRGHKTLLTDFVFSKLRTKKQNQKLFRNKIYSRDFVNNVSSLSLVCDLASGKKDKVAENILVEAGKELALSAKTVIKKLDFQNEKFPLVLVGSMFKSKIILATVEKEIKKFAPKTEFIRPKTEPVMGAVKLAIEQLHI